MLNAMTDEEYMQLALQEARAADVIGEIPIGAVLVVEGEVVARAHNTVSYTHLTLPTN